MILIDDLIKDEQVQQEVIVEVDGQKNERLANC